MQGMARVITVKISENAKEINLAQVSLLSREVDQSQCYDKIASKLPEVLFMMQTSGKSTPAILNLEQAKPIVAWLGLDFSASRIRRISEAFCRTGLTVRSERLARLAAGDIPGLMKIGPI